MNDMILSLIVPVYNVEKYLRTCIDSILPQLTEQMELILIDDGSTDQSGMICDIYAQKSTKVKVHHQNNMGVSVARNNGMKMAEGRWIGFIDSDDWLDTDFITTFLDYVEKDTDVFFYRYIEIIDGTLANAERTGKTIDLNKEEFEQLIHAGFNRDMKGKINYYKVNPSRPCKIYSRKVLQESKAIFPIGLKTGEDLIFNLQVYQYAVKGIYVEDAIYYHRVWNNSVSQKYDPQAVAAYELLQRKLEEWVQNTQNPKKYEADLMDKAMLSLGFCCMLQFCHPDNPHKYKERKREFMTTISKKPYAGIIDRVDIRHFRIKKQILFIFIKLRRFAIISWLCRLQRQA